jgi:hypothetical protein
VNSEPYVYLSAKTKISFAWAADKEYSKKGTLTVFHMAGAE